MARFAAHPYSLLVGERSSTHAHASPSPRRARVVSVAFSALVATFALVGCDGEQAPPSLAEAPAAAETAAPGQPAPAADKTPALSKAEPSKVDTKDLPSADDADVEEATGDDDAGSKDDDGEDVAKDRDTKKRRASKGSRRRSRAKGGDAADHADHADHATNAKKSAGDATGQVLTLKRIQLAEAVKDREPVDPEETFSIASVQKLYAFLELSNASDEEQKVVVTFVPPQGGATKVTLDVGAQKRWRTWALRKSIHAPGTWRVIVRDTEGHELGSRSFEVTE